MGWQASYLSNSYSGHSKPSSLEVNSSFTISFRKDTNYLFVIQSFAAVGCGAGIVNEAMAAGMCDNRCRHIALSPE